MESFVVPYIQIEEDESVSRILNEISSRYKDLPSLTTAIPDIPVIDLSKYTAQENISVEIPDFTSPYPLELAAIEGTNEYHRKTRHRTPLQVGDLLHLVDFDHWVVIMPHEGFAWVNDEVLKQYKNIEEMQFPHELLNFMETNQPTLIRAVFRSVLLQMMTSTDINKMLLQRTDNTDRIEGKLEVLSHLKSCLTNSIKEYLDGKLGR